MPLKLAAILVLVAAARGFAAEAMPVAQQNALVQKYCAVCHTDAVRNGGLTLQHFDAASAPPSLKAMMLSKLTGGVALERVKAAPADPAAAALVASSQKGGAMAAAGIPIPDQATVTALIEAFANGTSGAEEWHVNQAPIMTASILRELPLAGQSGAAGLYRLVLSCDSATRQGEMQLAWSPRSTRGDVSVVFDGADAVTYKVEGDEHMGNGSNAITGRAAIDLYKPEMALPAKSLKIAGLFPGESVRFSFSGLAAPARQSLAPCFSAR